MAHDWHRGHVYHILGHYRTSAVGIGHSRYRNLDQDLLVLVTRASMEQNRVGPQLILPNFVLPNRIGLVEQCSGLDSLQHCFDSDHFKSYPHTVEYRYNSRGFRDAEWPKSKQELQQAIWCIGDSFTVGIGSAQSHTWPAVAQRRTHTRTVNISMDGASNVWIARQARQVLKHIQPQHCVIQWSFLHRTENVQHKKIAHTALSADPDQNIPAWQALCREFAGHASVIQSVIPNAAPGIDRKEVEGWWWTDRKSDWPEILPTSRPDNVTLPQRFYHHWQLQSILSEFDVVLVEQQDLARDGFHYDIQTAEWFVSQILHRIS